MQASLTNLHGWLPQSEVTADAHFSGISTDSRQVNSGSLFVALRGEHFDGHTFLPAVEAQGAAAVMVEQVSQGLTVPAIVVPDTRMALGDIARHWRSRFALPVIGVTGSNGKTTVKEMIASILAAAFDQQYLATQGNFNNEIGVPLTLLRMDADCRAAVIELGMNHPGEIAVLAGIAQPTVGLVNNAQREHQEFMENVAAVARENGAVIQSLPEDGVAVFPADDAFTPLWTEYARSSGKRRIVTFGFSDDADVTCTYQPSGFGSTLSITALQQQFSVKLALAGEHNVRNTLAAVACTMAIGVASSAIVKGLEAFMPVNGRLQSKVSHNGALVIDDTYNANPDSVRAAIDVLANTVRPQVLVLGDMGEVGNEGISFHREIGAYARACGIDRLLTLGELAFHASAAFGTGAAHHDDIGMLNQVLDTLIKPPATVLVKGSRFMKMERIVQYLVNPGMTTKIQEVH